MAPNSLLSQIRVSRSGRPALLTIVLILLGSAAVQAGVPTAAAQTVDVTITSDNAYSFGYGNFSALTSLYGGVENCTAGQIFNCSGGPETYTGIPAPAGAYLYVVAYSDGSVTQGTLGQFVSGANSIYTGNGGWEVYATGHNINPNCGGSSNSPTLAAINAEIAMANAHAGGSNSSVGWVTILGGGAGTVGALAAGEDNSSSAGHFPIVCGIAATSRWMWYTPDPTTITDPFLVGPAPNLPSDACEYLIFRLPASLVVPISESTWGKIKATYRQRG